MHSQPSQRKSEVLVTMSLSHEQLDRLKERCEVVVAGWGLTGNRLDEDALCSMVQDVDILLVGYENISARVIQSARNLKIIGISRSNPVNVDINAANVRGIPVLHTPGRNAIAAAEYTMGLMLSQARNISSSDRALRNRNYLGHPKENLYRDNLD
ncbi:MAG: dihydrofolate reductase, partial [Chloroflexota bacterium]